MRHKVKHVHFVGIGGAGMSGIAEVLLTLRYKVSGSDLAETTATRRLRQLGAKVHIGHGEENIAGADAVVISSAVKDENPEVVAARAKKVPVVPRALMLAELMRLRQGIAVAGTHGKTTTTSLVASVLAEGGLDPTFVIGGRLEAAGSNARLGAGEFIVVEADESDASFLYLQPVVAVVTNIDADHMETYAQDFEKLKSTFVEFLGHLPFYGLAVVCKDDPNVRAIMPAITRPMLTYGIESDADLVASDIRWDQGRMRFNAVAANRKLKTLDVMLNLPGLHNVRNALAAIAVATELEVEDAAIQRALAGFQGIGRRLEVMGEVATRAGRVTLVDDYGHHPTEIEATIDAVRQAWPGRRLVLAFQPHRYTRTRDLIDDFGRALSAADALLVTEVYAAGEEPIANADGRAICRAVRGRGRLEPVFVEDVRELPAALAGVVVDRDVVLTMGAGSIGAVAHELPSRLGVTSARAGR